MGDILHFLWVAFRQYWSTWVTGTGLVGFALWLINFLDKRRAEKGRRTLTTRQTILILFCTFWFLATFSAWHDADKNLEAVKKQRERDTGDLAICQGDLKAERTRSASLDTLNHTLQGTISTQQTTVTGQQQNLNSQQGTMNSQQVAMNSCVVALGKANTPEPQKTILGSFNADFENVPQAKHKTLLFAFTNKAIPAPAKGVIWCTNPFKYASVGTASNAMTSEHPRPDDHTYVWEVISPQWTPTNPLIFSVAYDGNDLGGCRFELK